LRELRNVMERTAALVRSTVVDAADLSFLDHGPMPPSAVEFDLLSWTASLGWLSKLSSAQ
jgi:hypothetical protein